MTYYVEPDYWFTGYAEGDPTGGFVFGSAASQATGLMLSAANVTYGDFGGLVLSSSTALCGGSLTQIFPGINLNSKSQSFAAGALTSNSNGGLSVARSESRMTGRPFWEITSPASGTWTAIVPQAEGTGK